MAEIGSGTGSSYPAALDTDAATEVNSPALGKTKARAEVANDLAAAIVAIENELGTDPAGTLADVKTFLQTEHGVAGTHSATLFTKKWVALTATTDFSTTAASTSTITMNTDQTANILVGYVIKFTLSSVVYYAQCSAIASNLLTIRGAPLTTGAGALTAVSYSPLPSQVMELYLPVDGYYEDATETALLINDMRYQYKWNLSKAYVVAISHMQRTVDTGTEANVNVLVNSAAVCTANTNQGRAMSSTADTWVATDIDINTSNYDINYGETIEIQATKAGNGDAQDLTVSVVLVFP